MSIYLYYTMASMPHLFLKLFLTPIQSNGVQMIV